MASADARRILELAKTLSGEERAVIAGELLADLDYPGEVVPPQDAQRAWVDEARRRAERILHDAETGVAAEDVHADIERRLSTKT